MKWYDLIITFVYGLEFVLIFLFTVVYLNKGGKKK